MLLPTAAAPINSSMFLLALISAVHVPPLLQVLDNATPTVQVLVEIDERLARCLSDDDLDALADVIKVKAVKWSTADSAITETVLVAGVGVRVSPDENKRYLVCNLTMTALAAGTHWVRFYAYADDDVTLPGSDTAGHNKEDIDIDADDIAPCIGSCLVVSTAH